MAAMQEINRTSADLMNAVVIHLTEQARNSWSKHALRILVDARKEAPSFDEVYGRPGSKEQHDAIMQLNNYAVFPEKCLNLYRCEQVHFVSEDVDGNGRKVVEGFALYRHHQSSICPDFPMRFRIKLIYSGIEDDAYVVDSECEEICVKKNDLKFAELAASHG